MRSSKPHLCIRESQLAHETITNLLPHENYSQYNYIYGIVNAIHTLIQMAPIANKKLHTVYGNGLGSCKSSVVIVGQRK